LTLWKDTEERFIVKNKLVTIFENVRGTGTVLALALTFGLTLAGCATSIPAEVKHLPTLDTSSVKRLAVVPFKDSDGSQTQKQLAADLTATVSEIASGTGNFEMVSYESIQGPLNSGQDISLNVDALLTGDILSVSAKDDSRQVKRVSLDPVNKKMVERTVTVYDREVGLSFSYRLLRSRDRNVIGSEQRKSGTVRDTKDSRSDLASPVDLGRRILASQLKNMARDIAPWTEKVKLKLRKFDKELSKDKEAKASFKEADAAVKRGDFEAARDGFKGLYDTKKSKNSAFNAALMMEALGDANSAIALLTQIGASSEVSRIRKSVAAEEAVAEYQANKDSPVNKAISEASKGILDAAASKFPKGAKVAVMKSSSRRENNELLDYAVTGVTESLMSSNMTVVDRSANSAAIDAEKQYQMSGNVSDSEIVSIGNEYGAAVIIFFSITGSGNVRSLKVEAVSVQTKERLYLKTFEI
jgi:hypothetical protein